MAVERKIYTIEPILEERIWGGQELIKMFFIKIKKHFIYTYFPHFFKLLFQLNNKVVL